MSGIHDNGTIKKLIDELKFQLDGYRSRVSSDKIKFKCSLNLLKITLENNNLFQNIGLSSVISTLPSLLKHGTDVTTQLVLLLVCYVLYEDFALPNGVWKLMETIFSSITIKPKLSRSLSTSHLSTYDHNTHTSSTSTNSTSSSNAKKSVYCNKRKFMSTQSTLTTSEDTPIVSSQTSITTPSQTAASHDNEIRERLSDIYNTLKDLKWLTLLSFLTQHSHSVLINYSEEEVIELVYTLKLSLINRMVIASVSCESIHDVSHRMALIDSESNSSHTNNYNADHNHISKMLGYYQSVLLYNTTEPCESLPRSSACMTTATTATSTATAIDTTYAPTAKRVTFAATVEVEGGGSTSDNNRHAKVYLEGIISKLIQQIECLNTTHSKPLCNIWHTLSLIEALCYRCRKMQVRFIILIY